MSLPHCPICAAETGVPLLIRERVPATLNRPYATAGAASVVARAAVASLERSMVVRSFEWSRDEIYD